MAVEANTNVTTDFAKAQSIDFVNRFVSGIAKLQELLGITRRTVLSNGSVIKTYQSKVTLADGTVAEGDLIPLSKVDVEPAKTYELAYKKGRRAVTLEAIQRSGFDQGKGFWTIHKSYIVNSSYVSIYKYDAVQMTDGTILPISQKYRKLMKSCLTELYRKE